MNKEETKLIYIITGPNGAGKTTASFNILPEIFGIKYFINADGLAKKINPQMKNRDIQAGRQMLSQIKQLIKLEKSFAFETTLASKSYVSLIKKAQLAGYQIVLLFFALDTVELAQKG